MRRYLAFLFYYCLFATIGLFIWSVGFAPQPTGLVFVALLVPICIYFLLTIVRRKKVAVEDAGTGGYGMKLTIPLVILGTLFVSAVSISMYAVVRGMTTQKTAETTELTHAIADLKDLLAKTQSTEAAKLAGDVKDVKAKLEKTNTLSFATSSGKSASASADQVGFVTIADKNRTTVSAYKSASTSSLVVGRAVYGKTYLFLKKVPDWYYISLSADAEGWVLSQYVKEVSGGNL